MTIWAWGANSYGQLAQGHKEDVLIPTKVGSAPAGLKSITCGGGHTLSLTDTGQLWVCGSNNKGQLGLGTTDNVTTFTLIDNFKVKVVMVAAGWDFSLAVTDAGEIYSWGSNSFGQLGSPNIPSKCCRPCQLSVPGRVVHVAAGLRHAVALNDIGEIYCWGHAKKGQCGQNWECRKPVLYYSAPVKVSIPCTAGNIVTIVAGSYHSAAVSDIGNVVIWGCNKYGQSTQNPAICSQVNSPYVINPAVFEGHRIKIIRSGWTHLLAQADSGIVYSWGRCDYGQLGRSMPKDGLGYMSTPAPIDTDKRIIRLQCGSEHCLFLTDEHKLLSVGWNEHGLCGTGDEKNKYTITQIPALSDNIVTCFACGGGHCFAVTQDS